MKIEWDPNYRFVESVEEPIENWALKELAAELLRLEVNVDISLLGVPDAYDDGGWCIHPEGKIWLVYRAERGRRSSPAIFTSSFDAANFFLWKHIAQPYNENISVGMLPRRNN